MQEKYLELRQLRDFLQTFDSNCLASAKKQKTQSSKEQNMKDVMRKQFQFGSDEIYPLMDSSDNDEEEKKVVTFQEDGSSQYREMYEQDRDELQDLDLLSKDNIMSDSQYVEMFIEYVTDIFNKERGKDETKKQSLGDIKSTQVDTAIIIQQPIKVSDQVRESTLLNSDKNSNLQNVVFGNVKALIPIQRQKFSVESDENDKTRYRQGQKTVIREKRIFGVLTTYQLGFIPNLDVFCTEDEENFIKDSYIFRSLLCNSNE